MKRTLYLLSIIIVLLGSWFTFRLFHSYNYYKSSEFGTTCFYLGHSLEIYFMDYNEYPKDGKTFLKYCTTDRNFKEITGFNLNKVLIRQGLYLKEDEKDTSVMLISKGWNGLRNNDLIDPNNEKISFWKYLDLNNDIIVVKIRKNRPCGFAPLQIKVFQKGSPYPLSFDKELVKKIRKKIALYNYKLYGTYYLDYLVWEPSLYFKATKSDHGFNLELMCDPFNLSASTTTRLLDSLTNFFNREITYDSINFILFPFRLDSNSIKKSDQKSLIQAD